MKTKHLFFLIAMAFLALLQGCMIYNATPAFVGAGWDDDGQAIVMIRKKTGYHLSGANHGPGFYVTPTGFHYKLLSKGRSEKISPDFWFHQAGILGWNKYFPLINVTDKSYENPYQLRQIMPESLEVVNVGKPFEGYLVAVSRNIKRMAVPTRTGVRVIDLSTGDEATYLKGFNVIEVALSDDGKYLAAAVDDFGKEQVDALNFSRKDELLHVIPGGGGPNFHNKEIGNVVPSETWVKEFRNHPEKKCSDILILQLPSGNIIQATFDASSFKRRSFSLHKWPTFYPFSRFCFTPDDKGLLRFMDSKEAIYLDVVPLDDSLGTSIATKITINVKELGEFKGLSCSPDGESVGFWVNDDEAQWIRLSDGKVFSISW